MAHCTISNGITGITGALKKTTEQGVNHITVTRKKHIHDPPAHLAVALHSAMTLLPEKSSVPDRTNTISRTNGITARIR